MTRKSKNIKNKINEKGNYKNVIDQIKNINKSYLDFSSQVDFKNIQILGNSLGICLEGINKSFASISSIYSNLPVIDNLINKSAFIQMTRDANESISQIMINSPFNEIGKMFTKNKCIISNMQKNFLEISKPLSSYFKMENTLNKISCLEGIEKSLVGSFRIASSIGNIAELTIQAEKNISKINWSQLGSQINIYSTNIDSLSNLLIDYSNHFSKFYQSYEENPYGIFNIPPSFLRIPSVEFFNTSNIVEKISLDKEQDSEQDYLNNEIKNENEDTLILLLPKLNVEYLNLWKGANQALLSNNHDKVRHFIISLRELFTHVLHTIAPDNEIKKWTKSSDMFTDKNIPTRKARLLYLCRKIKNDDFENFINIDIKATLEFINIFQSNVHSIKSKLSKEQLMALKCKAESTLKYLLQVYFITKD